MKESGFIVRPEHFLRYLRKDLHLNASQTRLPRRAVHVFGGDEFRAVRRAIHGAPSAWSRWVAVGKAGRVPAAVFRSHIGAPASAMDLEEMDRATRLAKRGVVAVDMEAAALWTVARHRGMRVASVFVVSDELGGPGWNPGFHHERHVEGLRRAARVVVGILSRRGG